MPSIVVPKAAPDDLSRVQRWEDHTAWFLFVGSLLFFGCFTLTWVDPHPLASVRRASAMTAVVLWVWFFADYLIRLHLARGARKKFFITRLFDLISIVVLVFRPYLILVTVWRLPVFNTGDAKRQRIRYGLVTILFAFIYVYVNSYLVWAVEKDARHANIVNFDDAVWWGFTTISTVGYGDYVPVTALGRVLAIGLMIGGILIIGVTTATVISDLSDRIRKLALPEVVKEENAEAGDDGAGEGVGSGAPGSGGDSGTGGSAGADGTGKSDVVASGG
ncbi:MAG: potassium channel family protein [Leucobacter sp.]